MKKILITYATAGEGHKRAAFAIKNAFDILRPADVEVKIIDALDYTNQSFKVAYASDYVFIVSYFPTVWGFFYYLLDCRLLYSVVKLLRRIINGINTRPLAKFICDYNPDLIVTTHFLTSEVVSNLKRHNKIKAKLVTCVTDSRMHSFWFSDKTDFFCVGFEETMIDLIKKWNEPADKIKILGIPIHPKFSEVKNREEICNKLNISKNIFTVLITGGGFGVGPIKVMVKALLKADIELQVLVVCGHNEELMRGIDKLCANRPSHPPVKVKTFGFIDYVDELMTVSDVVITKAGGLVCSEALAKELPLVIVPSIPGQETRNRDLFLKEKVAFRLDRAEDLKSIIKRDEKLFNSVKENVRRIKAPDSSINIAKFVLGLINK